MFTTTLDTTTRLPFNHNEGATLPAKYRRYLDSDDLPDYTSLPKDVLSRLYIASVDATLARPQLDLNDRLRLPGNYAARARELPETDRSSLHRYYVAMDDAREAAFRLGEQYALDWLNTWLLPWVERHFQGEFRWLGRLLFMYADLTDSNIFRKRAILHMVAAARNYPRWTPEDTTLFREAFELAVKEGAISNRQLYLMLRDIAEAAPGWLITRYAFPTDDKPIYPEIRPDWAVMTESTQDAIDRERFYKWGGPDREAALRMLRERQETPGRPREILDLLRVGLGDEGRNVFKREAAKRREKWNHPAELAMLDKYPVANLAKYVHTPNPYVWEFCDHGKYEGSPDLLKKHLKEVRHRRGKVRVKAPHGEAARWDVHPLALPLFDRAEIVFLGIEGCLKADAILSQILIEGRSGMTVASCPAVGCWRDPRLVAFIEKYLQGKLVFVVPDADWKENDQVISQAMALREFLRRHGVQAYVAAPPVLPGAERDSKGKLLENGVDDYFASGGTLDDLEVVNREARLDKIREWARGLDGRNALRNAEVLASLSLYAGLADNEHNREAPGTLYRSAKTHAQILGCSSGKVDRAIDDLLTLPGLGSAPALTMTQGSVRITDGGFRATGRGFYPHRRPRSHYWDAMDYEERPRLTFASEFQARESVPVRLGDFKPGMDQFEPLDLSDAKVDRERQMKSARQARWRANQREAAA